MISLNDRFETVDQMLDEGAFARLLDRANQILEGAPQSSASRVASNVSHKIADYELLNVIASEWATKIRHRPARFKNDGVVLVNVVQ